MTRSTANEKASATAEGAQEWETGEQTTRSGMPVCVSLQISEEDYAALVKHFAKPEEERRGRPLVAVNKVFSAMFWNADINAAKEAAQ